MRYAMAVLMLCGAAVPGFGADDGEIPMLRVLKGTEGKGDSLAMSLYTSGLDGVAARCEAEGKDPKGYDLPVPDGGLLLLMAREPEKEGADESDKAEKSDDRFVPWILPGDRPKQVVIECAGGVVRVNDAPVAVDLSSKAGATWVQGGGLAKAATVRSLLLSGQPDVDLPALKAMIGRRGVSILADTIPAQTLPQYTEAVRAIKPECLALGGTAVSLLPLLKELPSLRCLVHSSGTISSSWLGYWPNLRELALASESDAEKTPDARFAELGKCKHLEALWLSVGTVSAEQLGAIAKSTGLRSLMIDKVHADDLSALAPLTKLYMLRVDATGLKSLAGVQKLTGLRELAIKPTGAIEDFSPIAKLPKLRLLIIDNATKKGQADRLAELKKANPELTISTGFCMGSIWLAAVVAAGLGVGLMWRWRRTRAA